MRLPLKEQIGGVRILFSHNVQFPSTHAHENERLSMDTIARVFPALGRLKKSPGEQVEIVGDTIVEEVLQDLGILDFGDGTSATANVALWRARGDHRPLIGEFAFELKFKRRQDLREKALRLPRRSSSHSRAPRRTGSPSAPPRRAWRTG